jgi:putative oxidoreductase
MKSRSLILSGKTHLASLILRIVFGGSMIYAHGWRKFLKVLHEDPVKFSDPIGLGPEISLYLTTFAEFFCAALVVIGLKSRLAVIPLMITMVVAILIVHAGDPFKDIEKGLLFFSAYLAIFLLGSGKFSLDYLLRTNNQGT